MNVLHKSYTTSVYEWQENGKNPSILRCLHLTNFCMLDEFPFITSDARLFIHIAPTSFGCMRVRVRRSAKVCANVKQLHIHSRLHNEIRCVTRKRGEKVKPKMKVLDAMKQIYQRAFCLVAASQ